MKLATVPSLQEDLGFTANMTDFISAADEALEAATIELAAVLDTDFDRGTYTDYFYVDEPSRLDDFNYATEFRLSHGLLDSVSVFKYATTRADAINGTDLLSTLLINKDRGVIRDTAFQYNRSFVAVTYIAGFDPDPDYQEQYNINQVPKWLQRAAKMTARAILADHPTVTQAEIKIDAKAVRGQVAMLMSRYLRYAPVAKLPL